MRADGGTLTHRVDSLDLRLQTEPFLTRCLRQSGQAGQRRVDVQQFGRLLTGLARGDSGAGKNQGNAGRVTPK